MKHWRPVSRENLGARAVTEHQREGRRLLRLLPLEPPVADRPRTRSDCANVPRPCPYVACRYNLYLDVTRAGSIKFNFPDLEPDEMRESCALDVAERGESTVNECAALMNLTHERVTQIEENAKAKFRAGGIDGGEGDDR